MLPSRTRELTYCGFTFLRGRGLVSTSACHAVMKVCGLSQLPRVAEKGNIHVQHQAVPSTGKQSGTLDSS